MRRLSLTLGALFLAGCNTVYPTNIQDLDAGNTSLLSRTILVSNDIPNPTPQQLAKPVVVAAHGFGATTFELKATTDYMRDTASMSVSDVLLGAHGQNIQAFEKSNWRIWQKPVIDEYKALKAKGYTDIRMFTTSTGGTLALEAMARGEIAPTRLAMVAPLAEIKNKLAGWAGLLPFIGTRYRDTEPVGGSIGRWYRFQPASTVISLVDLTEIVKANLKVGITLPNGCQVLIIQGDNDPTVDPVSADIISAGLQPNSAVTVHRVHSNWHIPVWPDGVDGKVFTPEEDTLRTQLIQEITTFLNS